MEILRRVNDFMSSEAMCLGVDIKNFFIVFCVKIF